MNPRSRARIRRWMGLVALTLTVSVVFGCATQSALREYSVLTGQGYERIEAQDLEGALASFEKQLEMAPGNPEPHYHMACAYARSGKIDEALAELETAAAQGFWYANRVRNDSDLQPLADDPRLENILEEMEEKARDWSERIYKQSPATLSIDDAAVFADYDSLEKEYSARLSHLEDNEYLYDWRRREEVRLGVLDQWAAAIGRYLRDHPARSDREEAASGLVEVSAKYRQSYSFYSVFPVHASYTRSVADAYLSEFPDGPSADRVAWLRLLSEWFSRERPSSATSNDESVETEPVAAKAALYTDEQIGRFLRQLGEFEESRRGTYEAGKALAWKVRLTFDRNEQRVDEDVRTLWNALEQRYGDDKQMSRYVSRWLKSVSFSVRGIRDFAGVDTNGKAWGPESMRGKVVLIDFWATWCGPCLSELPHLKEVYAEYKDRGFEILGVSLDFDDRAVFDAWLEKNDVNWPQIHEGKGWESTLAKQYDVRGIPFSVLIDRDGTVVGVDLRGEEVRKKVAALFAETDA